MRIRHPWVGSAGCSDASSGSRSSSHRSSSCSIDLASATSPVFIVAAAALIPLAWLIGEATEHAAHHTGPGIGGFINATFGNAPELIIALFAVADGLTEVVLRLVDRKRDRQPAARPRLLARVRRPGQSRSLVELRLLALMVFPALFLIPSIPGWTGDSRASLTRGRVSSRRDRPAPRLRRRSPSTRSGATTSCTSRTSPGDEGLVVQDLTARPRTRDGHDRSRGEILVGSIETFAEKAGLSDFFVAAVIVAIVGNAAEHGGAVIVAARGKIKLAAEIALSSSAQVAVFLVPAVAILSWAIDPLALSFRQIELAALAGALFFTALVLADGDRAGSEASCSSPPTSRSRWPSSSRTTRAAEPWTSHCSKRG